MPASPKPPLFGTYLYGWYDRFKWREGRCPQTPLPGFYRSSDPVIAAWQAEQIARTGLDFVAIEMVPHLDHSFANIIAHARNIIPQLARRGIGYVLFLDFLVFHQHADPIPIYADTMAILGGEGLLAGTFDSPHLGKAVFLFNPIPDLLGSIRQATPPELAIFPNSWQPTWGKVDVSDYPTRWVELFRPLWRRAIEGDVTLEEILGGLGYFQFWRYSRDPAVMNGIGSVIAGYDDMLLCRDPQLADRVPREGGRTMVEQMRQAVEAGARTIMIYGWNEYFEDAVIEPTLEAGDFYVELTRSLIAQVRRGEPVRFPDGLSEPKPSAPVYLTDALRRGAAAYADRVPRWDHDEYVAEIRVPSDPVRRGGSAIFESIRIANRGTLPWRPASAGDEIRAGARLFDGQGTVVREVRTELAADLPSGAELVVDLPIEIDGLPDGDYVVSIDVVWDGRFWFGSNGSGEVTARLQIRNGSIVG